MNKETKTNKHNRSLSKNKNNRKNVNNTKKNIQTLRNTYGYMTIPKGLTLYHAREVPYNMNNPDYALFLTFQVSDWLNGYEKYITKFIVKKDFDVLFMSDTIINGKVMSLLPRLLKKNASHRLNKQDENNLKCYFPFMIKEKLSGWFCSVEDRTGIELAIHNSNDFLEKIETVKMKNIINNENNIETNYNRISNNVEREFLITTNKYPVTLYINEVYKEPIAKLKEKSIKNNYAYPLQVLFNNAKITYFKNRYNTDMYWPC